MHENARTVLGGVVIGVALQILGCSGGGGAGEAGDTTPPSIVSSAPVGTDAIPIDFTFAVNFSEPLDPASVTSATATVYGFERIPIPVAGTVSSKCSAVAVKPAADLDPGTVYTFEVAGVTDAAGNALPTPFTHTFRTCALTQAIAAGTAHALGLRVDGEVWAWGANASGQVGDGTTENRSTPVRVAGLGDVTAIAAGAEHSLALKADGTVWAWGANAAGQLGDGTTALSSVPVQVTGLAGSVVTAVSGGAGHSLALADDGTVWSWGDNAAAQLGDGTTTDRTAAVAVTGLAGKVITAVSAGLDHSLARADDGTVWSWGANALGQLGDGTTTPSASPVQASGLTNVVAVAATYARSFALKDDGTVWVWGDSHPGTVCGGCEPIDTTRPRQILTGVAALGGGHYRTLFLTVEGTVVTWGAGLLPIVGFEAYTDGGGITNLVSLATNDTVTLAMKDDGTLWAWGANDQGQLGDGTTTSSGVAVRVKCSSEPTTPPPAPAPMTVTVGVYQLTVAWSGVPGAWSHDILYSTDSGMDPAVTSRIECATSPIVIPDLPDITHYVCVLASNGFGDGACSPIVPARPVPPPPPPPSGTCADYYALFHCGEVVNGIEYVMGLVPDECACPSGTTSAGIDSVTPGGPWRMCTCN